MLRKIPLRRLGLLGLVNGGIFLAALASLVLSLPPALSPFRLAVLSLLAVCAGAGLWLGCRLWTALDEELLKRRQAEQEARAADRAKGESLAHVSHEIRTPMNGVLGMAEVLLTGELTPLQRQQVEVIGRSAASLLALVNDVLDLSRIEARHLLIHPRDFSFQELAGDVLQLLAPRAAGQGVELHLHVDPALPDVLHGDPERLRQVLLNLVGNGIRFTSQGSVTVTAEPLERIVPLIRCEVRDTGAGIRPEMQERLFQPFTRSMTRDSGTGLGLVISRNIIELMGGEIGFRSTRGVGSTFWFQVPLVPARSAASNPPVPEAPEDGAEDRRARSERRILIVDDHPVNRSITLAQLQRLGYAAEAAESGEKALAALAERPCAAVLLDLEMPGLDGFETLRRLRGQEAAGGRNPPVPVIALTAHTPAEERAKCLAAGMNGFLPKPFRMAELAAVLDLWTGIETAADPVPESLEERLAALKSMGGETGGQVLADVVEAFLRQGETDLASVQRALLQGDGEMLAAAAHALSGSAALLGAAGLAKGAGELARLARQGELDACLPRLAEVEKEYRAVVRRLAPSA